MAQLGLKYEREKKFKKTSGYNITKHKVYKHIDTIFNFGFSKFLSFLFSLMDFCDFLFNF